MDDLREKLIDLVSDQADFLPWDIIEGIADYLIANGVTVQRWIPVTEQMPEYGQEVLVYTGNILKPIVMGYTFWRKDYDTWLHVTHWMPLPDPPKEVE